MNVTEERRRIVERIRQTMADRGIQQIDLAVYLCQTKKTVHDRLHERTEFKLSELIELCEFLGIEIVIGGKNHYEKEKLYP